MISKVITGGFPRGLFRYLDKDEAQIIGGNMIQKTSKGLTTEFLYVSEKNRYVKQPVKHHMLSFAKEDNVSHKKMAELARKYVKLMGYTDNQYVTIRHFDTDNDHIHIVINKVTYEGKSRNIEYEVGRSREICELMERSNDLRKTGRNSKKEYKNKVHISKKVNQYIRENIPFEALKKQLKQDGIDSKFDEKENKFTFEHEGTTLKGQGFSDKSKVVMNDKTNITEVIFEEFGSKNKSWSRKYEEMKSRINKKGKFTNKQHIENEVRKLLNKKMSFKDFKDKLKEKGITVDINKARNGINFEYNGRKFKGSTVHRDLSFNKIKEQIDISELGEYNAELDSNKSQSKEKKEYVDIPDPEVNQEEQIEYDEPDIEDKQYQEDIDSETSKRKKRQRKNKNKNKWRNM